MSQDDGRPRSGPEDPAGLAGLQVPPGQPHLPGYQPGHLPGYQPGYAPLYDPVTGQPLPPGPPAYSALDPAAPHPYVPYPAQVGYPGYPGQPPPGYRLVPLNGGLPLRPPTPGNAVAAAVLSFVQAAFVLMGGVVVLFGSLLVAAGGGRGGSEWAVLGILLLVVGGLTIAGGTMMLNRRSQLLVVSALLSLAVSLWVVVQIAGFNHGVSVWMPIAYAVLPVLAIAFSMSNDVRSWSRGQENAG